MLDKYNAIGWDLDGTLINHPSSEKMHSYILENPNKKHYLVTFRTYELVTNIERDLSFYNEDIFYSFDKIVTVPEIVWYKYAMAERSRRAGLLRGPLLKEEIEYRLWKGYACKKYNLEVMIDDNEDHVLPGCQKFGVDFIHADALTL